MTAAKPTVTRGGAPESVGQILPRIMKGVAPARPGGARSKIRTMWETAAGPELAQETRPSTLRRGVLTVEVRSASLLAELSGFRTAEMLARVLAVDPSGRVTGLRFAPGVF